MAWYGLYVCFVNSLYTTGATLLWKRESGVLRAFVIQSFNPVSLFSAVLFSPLTHDQRVGVVLLSAVWALVCVGAGSLGISRSRIRPSTLR